MTGIPMSWIIVLDQNVAGNLPTGDDAVAYATQLKLGMSFPVTADPTAEVVLKATPYNANARPGKCVLSPTMQILKCWTGTDDTQGFAAIQADVAANQGTTSASSSSSSGG